MENNKLLKPISNADSTPYRTSIVTIAEQFYELKRKNSRLNFAGFSEGSERLQTLSELSFKAGALAAIKESEREELQKNLNKYREEEANRVKMWEKEVSLFKESILKKKNKFRIMSSEKEPKILQSKYIINRD